MYDYVQAEAMDGDVSEDDCLGGHCPNSIIDSTFDSILNDILIDILVDSQPISNIDLSTLGCRQDAGTDFTLTILNKDAIKMGSIL